MTLSGEDLLMKELVVKKANFEKSIKAMKKLSNQNKELPELKRFEEKSWIFKKKVTGEEMNVFAGQVQENLINLNQKTNVFYKQFVEVYDAFESLDKEYIAGIVGAFEQAIEATKKAEDAQKDINATVDLLKITVERIKEFNSKVSSELSIIDSDNWKENALKHQKELDEIDAKADEIIKTINEYKNSHQELMNELSLYRKEVKKYKTNLIISWVVSGLSLIAIIVFIVLFVFYRK